MTTKPKGFAGQREDLEVSHLKVQVYLSSRRKTVAITVNDQGDVLVAAPQGADLKALEKFIHDKRYWIFGKLARREILGPDRSHKKFEDGETFPYLGRNHQLKIVYEDQDVPLKLDHGKFCLRHREAVAGRGHFLRWYRRHAKPLLEDRAEPLVDEMGVLAPEALKVRDLGTRWSACSRDHVLHFHWATILLPTESIDYLLVRTIAHLKHPRYTPEYWKLVEETLPDFPARSRWLIENGNDYAWL